jgi:hypothetical protein
MGPCIRDDSPSGSENQEMATLAQAYFVSDLAVQAGVLNPTLHDRCRTDVLGWDNLQVTGAIKFLKDRIWRSRARATGKQIEYGKHLLEQLAILTDTEPEDLDFELFNSLQATEELTKLEALIALLTALDFDPFAVTGNENLSPSGQPLRAAQSEFEPDIAQVFKQMAQQN